MCKLVSSAPCLDLIYHHRIIKSSLESFVIRLYMCLYVEIIKEYMWDLGFYNSCLLFFCIYHFDIPVV